jgi:alkylation response protein AidB-like acyl-CoA dehydrogenase
MTKKQKALQEETRRFVKDEVSPHYLRAMDRDEIKYPREIIEKLGSNNLLGLRFDPKWGGRGLSWADEVIAEEEIGVLGSTLGCAYVMPRLWGRH